MLIEHHYNIEFNYRDVFDAYFRYTDKLFDDLEDKSIIMLDEMVRILIDCINGKKNEKLL